MFTNSSADGALALIRTYWVLSCSTCWVTGKPVQLSGRQACRRELMGGKDALPMLMLWKPSHVQSQSSTQQNFLLQKLEHVICNDPVFCQEAEALCARSAQPMPTGCTPHFISKVANQDCLLSCTEPESSRTQMNCVLHPVRLHFDHHRAQCNAMQQTQYNAFSAVYRHIAPYAFSTLKVLAPCYGSCTLPWQRIAPSQIIPDAITQPPAPAITLPLSRSPHATLARNA